MPLSNCKSLHLYTHTDRGRQRLKQKLDKLQSMTNYYRFSFVRHLRNILLFLLVQWATTTTNQQNYSRASWTTTETATERKRKIINRKIKLKPVYWLIARFAICYVWALFFLLSFCLFISLFFEHSTAIVCMFQLTVLHITGTIYKHLYKKRMCMYLLKTK